MQPRWGGREGRGREVGKARGRGGKGDLTTKVVQGFGGNIRRTRPYRNSSPSSRYVLNTFHLIMPASARTVKPKTRSAVRAAHSEALSAAPSCLLLVFPQCSTASPSPLTSSLLSPPPLSFLPLFASLSPFFQSLPLAPARHDDRSPGHLQARPGRHCVGRTGAGAVGGRVGPGWGQPYGAEEAGPAAAGRVAGLG